MKRALITGVTDQDGSHLTELLQKKGYEVHGIIRRASTFNIDRIDHLYVDPHRPDATMFLHYGDLVANGMGLRRIIEEVEANEIYNLGALRLLEAIRDYCGRTGKDLSIRELALLIKDVVGFEGELVFDSSKSDGTPRKLLDVSRLREAGWLAKTSLQEGVEKTYEWYLRHIEMPTSPA